MGSFKDKTNQVYGYLTVIERANNIGAKVAWKCRCNCGNIVIKRGDSLKPISMCEECDKLYRKGLLLNPLGELHPGIKNEVGNRYGKLTVIEIDTETFQQQKGVMWKCLCDCGNYKSVRGTDLRSNKYTSCGCNRITLENPGTRYGKLTIVKRVENSNAGKAKYLCKCDCGNYCQVVGSDLRSGQQISCGCIKSKGEYKITQLLIDNNIPYQKEKTFDSCKDVNLLPFDFFINNQYLIEYDGKQHFSSKNAWDEDSYKVAHYHDNIKNQWCKENNIPLIRIPYTHYDDLCIKDLLLESSSYIVSK